jgi:hypothetical protein
MKPTASIFLSWEEILPHLYQHIKEAAPEVKGKITPMILRGRKNGFWLEFYKDEAALVKRRLQIQLDGPEIIAGELDLRS